MYNNYRYYYRYLLRAIPPKKIAKKATGYPGEGQLQTFCEQKQIREIIQKFRQKKRNNDITLPWSKMWKRIS